MSLPFTLPDWLPAWVFLLVALPALLYLFVFLLMPFSVFGLKARLETIESQLDAVQEELRGLSRQSSGLAMPRPRLDEDYDVPNFGMLKSARSAQAAETPPPMVAGDRFNAPPVRPVGPPPPPPPRPRRTEPRLD